MTLQAWMLVGACAAWAAAYLAALRSRALYRRLWRHAQRSATYWRERATGVQIVENGGTQSWEWAEKTPRGARLADIVELPCRQGADDG